MLISSNVWILNEYDIMLISSNVWILNEYDIMACL